MEMFMNDGEEVVDMDEVTRNQSENSEDADDSDEDDDDDLVEEDTEDKE